MHRPRESFFRLSNREALPPPSAIWEAAFGNSAGAKLWARAEARHRTQSRPAMITPRPASALETD